MEQAKKQKVVIKKKEFVGRVLEVHSGDSLTIQSVKFGTTGRFMLTNIRAPQIYRNSNKPYAFEAKEFLRKWLIGKEVQVKMEYEKTFNVTREVYDEEKEDVVEVTEEKTNIFAMVEFENKQVAVEVVAKGLANVQKPYTEEEQSVIYEELKAAEKEAITKKIGLHKPGEYKPRFFRDLTDKSNLKAAKNVFEHLKDAGRLTGVVELVLNGSRFKVRCNEQNCYFMMVVQGVRCLPNDENFVGYDVWSNKAMQYSKQHILQRDVEIYMQKIDKKGIYQGKILFNKRQDYAETLLSEGLAVSFGSCDKQKTYEEVEAQAKSKKVGLWNANINLQGVKGNFGRKEVQFLNEKKNVEVSEVVDVNEFYLQVPGNPTLKRINDELADYDPTNRAKLGGNIKANTPCLALFSADDLYYRANVVREVQNKKDKYLVHFIDYGNYEEVHYDDMRKMPEGYLKIAPQAEKCALAYVEGPYKKTPCWEDSIDSLMDKVWQKKLTAHYSYRYGDITFVNLYPTGDSDINSQVGQQLLKEGLAKIDGSVDLPQGFSNWVHVQEKAQDKRYGVWQFDEED